MNIHAFIIDSINQAVELIAPIPSSLKELVYTDPFCLATSILFNNAEPNLGDRSTSSPSQTEKVNRLRLCMPLGWRNYHPRHTYRPE